MKTRNILIIAAIAAVISNAVVMWSHRRPVVRHIDAPTARVAKLLEWESLPVNPLKDSQVQLVKSLQSYKNRECSNVPSERLASFDDLNSAQQGDLVSTVAELVSCYLKSDGAALVNYMQTRNEHLSPRFRELAVESLLTSQLIRSEDAGSLSDSEIVAKVWANEGCKTRWHGIAHDAGSICVWRCEGCDPKSMQTLGTSDNRLFHSQAVSTHLFEPEWSFENAHKQSSGVLMADVKLLIQHDTSAKSERSPYFVRFWYSEADQIWHPFHFIHIRVEKNAGSNSVSMMF